MIPDNNMVPAIGALEYVEGCQVWNGKIGTLIANARKNPPSNQTATSGASSTAFKSSMAKLAANDFKPINEASMNNDPKNVYMKNFIKAALMKFFMYTFFGSLFMLASLIGLKSFAASFAIEDLKAVELAPEVAVWLLGGFFLAFAIKVPIFPFHTWQPSTYSKAPMAGTMLLSGIMLKMALYGMLRWMLPLFPEALDCVTLPIIVLGTIGVVYGAILAIKQAF